MLLLLHLSGRRLKSESGNCFSPRPTPARTGSAPRRCGAQALGEVPGNRERRVIGVDVRRTRLDQMAEWRGYGILGGHLAYGSNMAAEVMEGLCPRNRFLGVARLSGYRLAFTRRSIRTGTGVADVIPARNQTVWGALYEIEDDELTAIDRKEGYGWAYTRVMCRALLEAGGQGQMAVVYTVHVKEPAEIMPSRQYLDRLIAAAHERRLPKAYAEKLEAMVVADSADKGRS